MASEFEKITIESLINAPVEKVWDYWTRPEHIIQWNHASSDWHTTHAVNDLKVGGQFLSRMEAKDGTEGFNFTGIYDHVDEYKFIAYTLADTRKVEVNFEASGKDTKVKQVFDAEKMHSIPLQKAGWQAILNEFKDYVETLEN